MFNLFFISVSCAEYIEEIKSGEEKFEALASQFSDCSSAKNGGDLGLFGRGTHSHTQSSHTHSYTVYIQCVPLHMQTPTSINA